MPLKSHIHPRRTVVLLMLLAFGTPPSRSSTAAPAPQTKRASPTKNSKAPVARNSPTPQQLVKMAKECGCQFPYVVGEDMTRKRRRLPFSLAGKFNIVFIAYKRVHQKSLKRWTPLLKKLRKQHPGLDYMKLPLMGSIPSFVGFFIKRGMRKMVKDPLEKARMVPLFIRKGPFKRALRVKQEKHVELFIVDRKGRVYGRLIAPTFTGSAPKLRKLLQRIYGT